MPFMYSVNIELGATDWNRNHLFFRIHGAPILGQMEPLTVFSVEEELKMQQFLLDAWMMRIPRTQEVFANDVKYFPDYINRNTKFTNKRPGYFILNLLCETK